MKIWLAILMGLWLFLAIGCTSAREQLYANFQNEDPSVRMQAISQAGKLKDSGSLPYLVDRLTDSERDVRFLAILALERITGETMGYRYYKPSQERAKAVQRWRQWLARQGGQASTDQETGEKK